VGASSVGYRMRPWRPGVATRVQRNLWCRSVKAYNKSLYRKLGVGGRQDAVRVARQLQLI
jgi:hypothetical protein